LSASHVVPTDHITDALEILKLNSHSFSLEALKALSSQIKDSSLFKAVCSGSFLPQKLSFGETAEKLDSFFSSSNSKKFDVVLGSYILYDPDQFEPICRSLESLTHSESNIIMTSHEPTRRHLFLQTASKYGFQSWEIPYNLFDSRTSDGGNPSTEADNYEKNTSILWLKRSPQA
jgi:hypothetical protein